jgi:hypothetical protein
MNLIIAGGRDFDNYSYLEKVLNHLLSRTDKETITIFCGKAKGADSLGERYALHNGIRVREFPADWNTHGKRAGILRNIEMGDEATHLVAFHDTVSRGTKQMIDYAEKKGLVVKVYNY